MLLTAASMAGEMILRWEWVQGCSMDQLEASDGLFVSAAKIG